MRSETEAPSDDRSVVLAHWSARKMHPSILLYVALVFLACMALAAFVFHSTTGVKALAIAAGGFLVPLVPAVLSRVEYRLTETGLEHRSVRSKEPKAFEEVFQWSRLDHVVPMRHGFKYYDRVDESNALRRFGKIHLSDKFSGEVHVGAEDRDRVLRVLTEREVPMSKRARAS